MAATRHTLLGRLRDWEDQASWREFFDLYASLIYQVALTSGLTAPEAQDVVQETMISVAKKMKAGQYDRTQGSFRAWLLRGIHWRTTEQFRRRLPGAEPLAEANSDEEEELWSSPKEVADPEALRAFEREWTAEWEKQLLTKALERVRQKARPKQYQIFEFSVLRAWSMAKVRRSLLVSTLQVYLARHRVGRLLAGEIAALKRELGDP